MHASPSQEEEEEEEEELQGGATKTKFETNARAWKENNSPVSGSRGSIKGGFGGSSDTVGNFLDAGIFVEGQGFGWPALASRVHPELRSISLDSCQLGATAVQLLVAAISSLPLLESLSLAGNPMAARDFGRERETGFDGSNTFYQARAYPDGPTVIGLLTAVAASGIKRLDISCVAIGSSEDIVNAFAALDLVASPLEKLTAGRSGVCADVRSADAAAVALHRAIGEQEWAMAALLFSSDVADRFHRTRSMFALHHAYAHGCPSSVESVMKAGIPAKDIYFPGRFIDGQQVSTMPLLVNDALCLAQ